MHNRIIITGGAGFIGSNFIRYMTKKYPNYQFINIDNLTYSGNKNNLKDLESSHNYQFIEEDICNTEAMNKVIKEGDIVINFAAESHVDNSIKNPSIFIKTNVLGTHSILEAARKKKAKLFLQISTDEVYGSLNFEQESSKETHFLKPSSPYSGSKAAAEMVCIGNIRTFQQPIIITRSSNNFGPYQYPEKVIPLFLTNLFEDKKVPLYGEGKNVRDWIYVEDNCSALLKTCGKDESSIEYVEDRLGHDLRYSIDSSKTKSLGWKPQHDFKDALKLTVEWYKNNPGWWEPLKK